MCSSRSWTYFCSTLTRFPMIHFEKRYTGVPFDAFITNTHYITDFNNKEVRAVITVAA